MYETLPEVQKNDHKFSGQISYCCKIMTINYLVVYPCIFSLEFLKLLLKGR